MLVTGCSLESALGSTECERSVKMAVHQPFPRGTFKVERGPGEHEVSVIFKPTQSTIVFFIIRPAELAPEYHVHHTRTGRFGHFDETEVCGSRKRVGIAVRRKSRAEIGTTGSSSNHISEELHCPWLPTTRDMWTRRFFFIFISAASSSRMPLSRPH